MPALQGKKILLGVSGSIAAYKAIYLLRALQNQGAEVRVIMTPAAAQFVNPLSFEAITHSPVYTELINNQSWNSHIEISLWADLYLIAPATAHTIAKFAHGFSDDLVSATYLASRCPVYLAPSMDVDMWHHDATQSNIQILHSRGVNLIPVGNGYLASGLTGMGRMAEPDDIIDFLIQGLAIPTSLQGKKVLITAGPTHENIDPVRYIGNASTGKMGISIAYAFLQKGCAVTLILGPSHLATIDANIKCIKVRSALQMFEAAKEYADRCLSADCDEVVGIGGGKIMDFSKAVAETAGLGTVNIPTSIATCAAFTSMSVMYTPEGAKKTCWRFEHEIDAVLVDMDVIAKCPIRYTAAGILDAMAKKIEIQNGRIYL